MKSSGYIQAFAGRKHHLYLETAQLIHLMNYFILKNKLFIDFI